MAPALQAAPPDELNRMGKLWRGVSASACEVRVAKPHDHACQRGHELALEAHAVAQAAITAAHEAVPRTRRRGGGV